MNATPAAELRRRIADKLKGRGSSSSADGNEAVTNTEVTG
jgi:hypothetical protein